MRKRKILIIFSFAFLGIFGLAKISQAVYPAPRHFRQRFRLFISAIAKRLCLSAILLVKFYQKMAPGPVAGLKRLSLPGFLFACCIFFVSFTFASPAYGATTYYVSPSGDDNASGLIDAPFKTIQKAADIVDPGDTVIVKDGVYTDTDNNGMVVWLKRSGTPDAYITFKSENKWGAILHGQNNKAGQGFQISDSASYINIYDFQVTEVAGGGFNIRTWTPAPPNRYVIIRGNYIHHMGNYESDSAYGQGGGIYTENAEYITIDSNFGHDLGRTGPDTFWLNKDHAVYIANYAYLGEPRGTSRHITVTNNIFYSCSGSAITMGGEDILVSNNTLAWSNTNSKGGTQLLDIDSGTKAVIQNNTFYQPPSSSDGKRAIWFWWEGNYSSVTIRSNIVYDGTMFCDVFAPPYSITPQERMPVMQNNYCTRDCENAGIDPKLVMVSNDGNFSNDNWHLQSTSPAIDKGIATAVPTLDFDGNIRPQGGFYDIGAYEYVSGGGGDITSPAAPSGLAVQ